MDRQQFPCSSYSLDRSGYPEMSPLHLRFCMRWRQPSHGTLRSVCLGAETPPDRQKSRGCCDHQGGMWRGCVLSWRTPPLAFEGGQAPPRHTPPGLAAFDPVNPQAGSRKYGIEVPVLPSREKGGNDSIVRPDQIKFGGQVPFARPSRHPRPPR